ncbi:MAG TPA: DUF1579 family protein, partial [Opitutus sp.]|nr:DUF1579 family protein [Opitutus sp.]
MIIENFARPRRAVVARLGARPFPLTHERNQTGEIPMETTTETNQQAYMEPEPQPEHRWLERLAGEWTFESDCDMGPGKPREKFKG